MRQIGDWLKSEKDDKASMEASEACIICRHLSRDLLEKKSGLHLKTINTKDRVRSGDERI